MKDNTNVTVFFHSFTSFRNLLHSSANELWMFWLKYPEKFR